MKALGHQGTPIKYLASEVRDLNLDLAERNLLSLSYGRIVRKDIDSNEGLLPASFERYTKVRPGDTVLRLTDLQNDQRSLRSGLVREAGIITSAYLTLRPRSGVDPRFFSYALHALDVGKTFYALGGGLRQSMGMEEVSNLRLELMELAEQRRIADFLDNQGARIDAAIARRRKQAELLSELMTSRIGSLVKGDTHSPFPTTKLRYLANLITGLTYSPDNVCGPDVGTALLRSGNVQESRIVLEDLVHVDSEIPSELLLRPGDILMCSRNGSARLLGKNAVIAEDQGRLTFGAFMTVIRSDMPEWLSWVFRSDIFHAQLGRYSTATINQLTLGMLADLDVPLPTAEMREAVATCLRAEAAETHQALEALRTSVELLGEYKRSLITAAVTRELDVTTARSGVSA